MYNLPRDLPEEVLCRIPLTSLRPVRSTCKKWSTLSKCGSFAKKHLAQAKVLADAKEFMVVLMMNFRVYLMRVNLQNNVVESSSSSSSSSSSCIKREAKLISLGDEEADISQVFHCDGLLLCISITESKTRLVVWNPYWGHTRLFEPTHQFNKFDSYSYALGYDKSRKSHKILRGITCLDPFKIYDFNSDLWRDLDVTPEWHLWQMLHGVSLKGNAYWFARENYTETMDTDHFFLLCFDFTSETFGPPLPLPFEFAVSEDTMSVSSVREEQLVVLYQPWDYLQLDIWVTSKIEPNAVSWNSKVFLSVSLKQLVSPQFQLTFGSFFIDEEKKVAVVFDKDYDNKRNIAYIFGVDGSFKAVDLGDSDRKCFPLVCSYVPSLVQLN
ncbi:F-box and associated interaction domains-containing protein [Arabidopsis thaliana]|jgi:F-box interacting protein|uniref:F-box protein At3g19470 n=1 Tax=Arabidopsis thaliana TaxID=3702 RepID=FB163_ARATH|nr:F-box and associated interaction domains-containing protein [Arabidopsis thaliana]NP_566636.1 F-box and associated interaction domains-containing protein [Arabidopsis thaliana]Q8LCE9.1 RecName: Full=F-box protein At3g19470 [Arabidopsis thaliana]AAM63699.1 unknown [Arabidopsis thaliana]AAP21273.1 At3g19470 [Arabidopsis thaliana]AEE76244.1 F-box and associated interaction domains-containing protein [Arabidopsis thaliana]AEE76245.1 F-box and associated interaction domains-containing protein [|eukprot:NP_001030727.1 F-box and associated interaction domains-containing protein [Arabidopsis thaliana]